MIWALLRLFLGYTLIGFICVKLIALIFKIEFWEWTPILFGLFWTIEVPFNKTRLEKVISSVNSPFNDLKRVQKKRK